MEASSQPEAERKTSCYYGKDQNAPRGKGRVVLEAAGHDVSPVAEGSWEVKALKNTQFTRRKRKRKGQGQGLCRTVPSRACPSNPKASPLVPSLVCSSMPLGTWTSPHSI